MKNNHLVFPFNGLRPAADLAEQIAAPPYDVINRAEAHAMAKDNPLSFLHISRPEIDLPESTDPYDDSVYQQGSDAFSQKIDEKVFLKDAKPCFYLYQLQSGEHIQTGLVSLVSAVDYDNDIILKHEFTRPVKENDRVRHIESLGAQTGPVLLTFRANSQIKTMMAAMVSQAPEYEVTAYDGVIHRLWRIEDDAQITDLQREMDALGKLYIADGHHRSAAASRVAKTHREQGCEDNHPSQFFLAVSFPDDDMLILDYNRVVKDLNGHDQESFIEALSESFDIAPMPSPEKPTQVGEYGMYIAGEWHRLTIKPSVAVSDDPVEGLSVSILAKHLIEPVLGITDPRRDDRIDFVGGVRGLEGLEKRVDSGEMVLALAVAPTPIGSLLAVADSGQVMPPKSTWFEPKLVDGLVSYCFRD